METHQNSKLTHGNIILHHLEQLRLFVSAAKIVYAFANILSFGVISRSLDSARLVLSFQDLDHPIYFSMHLSSRISSSKHHFMIHIQLEIPHF